MHLNKKTYQTPEAESLEIFSEPILNNPSGNTESYGKGAEYGESDFD